MNTEDSEFERIEREQAMRGVPDAITDDSESPEYRTGWNECRQAMLAEQPAQQDHVGVFCEDDDIGHVRLDPHQQMKLKDGDKLYTTPQAQREPVQGWKLVPVLATREIEDAIGKARNLKASEIWEDALAAAPKAQPAQRKPPTESQNEPT